jgi:hypothetical protein
MKVKFLMIFASAMFVLLTSQVEAADELASRTSGGYLTVGQCQKHLDSFGCNDFFQSSNVPAESRLTCSASQGAFTDAKDLLAQEISALGHCTWGGGEAAYEMVSLLWKIPIGAYDLAKEGIRARKSQADQTQIAQKFYDECAKTLDCRQEVLLSANGKVSEDYTANVKTLAAKEMSGSLLQKLAKGATLRAKTRRFSEASEKIRAILVTESDTPERDRKIREIYPEWREGQEPSHEAKSVAALLQEFFKKQGQKLMCYSKPARQEMICYGLASIFAPGAALKMAEKSKLLLASNKAAEVKKLQQATRAEEVAAKDAYAVAASEKRLADAEQKLGRKLTEEELKAHRVSETERLIGRELSPSQREALERAHKKGEGELGADRVNPAALGNYTVDQKVAKGLELRRAGFSPKETKAILDEGIAGGEGTAVAVVSQQKEYFKTVDKVLTRLQNEEKVLRASDNIRDAEIARTKWVGIKRACAERTNLSADCVKTFSPVRSVYSTDDPAIALEAMILSGQKAATLRATAEPFFKTSKEAEKRALELGYVRTSSLSEKEVVFEKNGFFITRDRTGHNGGAFKGATSVLKLGQKKTRRGTFDENLVRIGD